MYDVVTDLLMMGVSKGVWDVWHVFDLSVRDVWRGQYKDKDLSENGIFFIYSINKIKCDVKIVLPKNGCKAKREKKE